MTHMPRRWHAYLAWGFVLLAAACAVGHVQSNYQSDALARIALWSTILAVVFAAWSFSVRANERWKPPSGFDVVREPDEE